MRYPFAVLVAALAANIVTPARAQQYPTHPVKIIVGFAAGSGPDVLARAVAIQLSADLKQNFYVENRVGANGTIGLANLTQSAADGYTLLYSSNSITPIPYVYKNLSFDILRDLAPIATVGILDGHLMLVHPSSPAHNVPEFIAYAKTKPLLYGSPGVGNALHLVTEMFRLKAGIMLQHIPYKGASEVQTALLGKNIDVMFVTPPSVIGVVKEGKLRAIAFTGHKPFPEFPDVPLMSASLPSFEDSPSWGMFYAPAKTPREIVDKLNTAIRHALTVPAVSNIVQRAGYFPDGRSAAETAEFFRKEVEATAEAVRVAGIGAR